MRYAYTDHHTGGLFRVHLREERLGRDPYAEAAEAPCTIVWNRGSAPAEFHLDAVPHALHPDEVTMITAAQSFAFDPASELVVWQFNREFYCIVDHDREVSCAGLLFYGTRGRVVVRLDDTERRRFELLLAVFEDEYREADNLQGEMLRMLLKRLIVKLTRLYKQQALDGSLPGEELDAVRQFGLLVELHFRENHQVQDYADLMHKSPKTLANLFGQHAQRTPLQVIQERIALEARRMLIYTDQTAAEIGYALGFGEPAHFSRFFKRKVGEAPGAFRRGYRAELTQ